MRPPTLFKLKSTNCHEKFSSKNSRSNQHVQYVSQCLSLGHHQYFISRRKLPCYLTPRKVFLRDLLTPPRNLLPCLVNVCSVKLVLSFLLPCYTTTLLGGPGSSCWTARGGPKGRLRPKRVPFHEQLYNKTNFEIQFYSKF